MSPRAGEWQPGAGSMGKNEIMVAHENSSKTPSVENLRRKPGRPLNPLIRGIMESTGCSRATAYRLMRGEVGPKRIALIRGIMAATGTGRSKAYELLDSLNEAEREAVWWRSLSVDERREHIASIRPYNGDPRSLTGTQYLYRANGELAIVHNGVEYPVDWGNAA